MDLFLQVQAAAWTGLLRAQLKAAFTLIKSQAGSVFRKQLRSDKAGGSVPHVFVSKGSDCTWNNDQTVGKNNLVCKAGVVQIVSISFNTKHHSHSLST